MQRLSLAEYKAVGPLNSVVQVYCSEVTTAEQIDYYR